MNDTIRTAVTKCRKKTGMIRVQRIDGQEIRQFKR